MAKVHQQPSTGCSYGNIDFKGKFTGFQNAPARARTQAKAALAISKMQINPKIPSHISGLPPDLNEIVGAWADLPVPMKNAVLAIVRFVNSNLK